MEARGQDLRVDLSLNPEHSKLIFGMWTANSPTMQKGCLTKANIFRCLFSRALPQRRSPNSGQLRDSPATNFENAGEHQPYLDHFAFLNHDATSRLRPKKKKDKTPNKRFVP